MGKRSSGDFKRNERDFYPTPYEAVVPLFPFLPPKIKYAELCAGAADLIMHLETNSTCCVAAYDIEPQHPIVKKKNALDCTKEDLNGAQYIITNPVWDRPILHRMIQHFRMLAPTFLLFDADWMHTVQSAPYMPFCAQIISVGRVQWIPGSDSVGMDNCAWYKFVDHEVETIFTGRTEKTDKCAETLEMF
jgi:hypothetical protein